MAQTSASRLADSLMRRGMLERAESVYYAEARRAPRDPQARANLGLHLVARGAVKIGTTLLEEALQFGGDPATLSKALYDSYWYLNDFPRIAKLPVRELTVGQQRRLTWLVAHSSRLVAPDSMFLIALARSPVDSFIGITPVRLNGVAVKAHIDPRTRCKIILSDTSRVAARLRAFPDPADRRSGFSAAVADSVGLGRATVMNVPIELAPLPKGVEAVICLGELMPLAPTFDLRAGLMTLRMSGSAPRPSATSTAFPFYAAGGRLSLLKAGGMSEVTGLQVRSLFGDNRWTLDTKRGQIVVENQRP